MAKLEVKATGESQLARFVASYRENFNAVFAAQDADIVLTPDPPVVGCYVYALLDPANAKVVYVGKGTKDRMKHHMRDVLAGKVSGLRKHRGIMEMVEDGRAPVAVVILDNLSERAALKFERLLIYGIGRGNLLNSSVGEGDKWETARENMNRLKPGLGSLCGWLKNANVRPDLWKTIPFVLQEFKDLYAHIEEKCNASH